MSPAASQPTAGDTSCAVCGRPLRPDAQADCYSCGQYFHLGLTANSDVEDCGQVWLDDEVLALQFACNSCLEAQSDAAPGSDADDERRQTFNRVCESGFVRRATNNTYQTLTLCGEARPERTVRGLVSCTCVSWNV